MRVRAELFKLTVFVAVAAVLGSLLYITLARGRIGPSDEYHAVLANATGLEKGDLVRIAGVEVGQVDDVSIGGGNSVDVSFHIDKGRELTDRTVLYVRYQNLLGDRYMELTQPPDVGSRLATGSTIPESRTHGALDLDVLLNGFKPLFQGLQPQQVNQLATSIIDTLQGQGGTVADLLAHTASLTNGLADRNQVITDLIDNLNVVLGNLDEHDAAVSGTVDQLQKLVSGLAADRDPIGHALSNISTLTISTTRLLAAVRPALKDDLTETRLVSAIVNRNAPELRSILHQVPLALKILSRVGSHGAFFNFYLCGVSLRVTGPNGPIDVPGLSSNNATARCKQS